jgi:hypothetical protein
MVDLAEAILPVIAIVFIFGIPGAIIFYAIHNSHKERMRLMEMGLTPEEARNYFKDSHRKPRNPYSALKWGLLLAFVGIALFIGFIINEVWDVSDSVTPSLVIFFGGLGFIIYYMLIRSKIQNGNGQTGEQTGSSSLTQQSNQ